MENSNVNGIFLSNAIISLLDLLNTESYFSIDRDDDTSQIHVPFFYNFGNDEQFMRDFFISLPPGCNIPLAEGNYEKVPRGIITLTDSTVSTKDMTNKFIRGAYQAEERDQNDRKIAVGHNARIFSIPLILTFSIEVRVDTMNEAFKIWEMFLDTFYANRVVHFQYKGLRIPGQFRFPDAMQNTKNYTFDYATAPDNWVSIKLSCTMETYFPSFDRASNRNAKNVMQQLLLSGAYIDQNTALGESITVTITNGITQIGIGGNPGSTKLADLTIQDSDTIDLTLTPGEVLSAKLKTYETTVSGITDLTVSHTTHNLGKIGSILLEDSAGNIVFGNANIAPNLDVVFHFDIPFSGDINISA